MLKEVVDEYKDFSITDIIGDTNEPTSDYDLMTIVIIRRGDSNSNAQKAIFDYLSGVFNSDINRINKYVDISNNEPILKGVRKMGGLGQTIAENNYKKGILDNLVSLVQKGLLTLSAAANEAKMTEDEFSLLLKKKDD